MTTSGLKPERPSYWRLLRQAGPGIAIAATGVGAADLVASAVAGSRHGTALAWAVVVGAVLKFVLNEGVARWHLATGTSVLQGGTRHLGKPVLGAFLAYLAIWSFMVAGGLIVVSGLAAGSVLPVMTRQNWGILQALAALGLVWMGSYDRFERLMKILIALMFVAIIGCATAAAWTSQAGLAAPALPPHSLPLTLGLCGGVGGSVTMLVYGYWMGEKQWSTPSSLTTVRLDLGLAYGLTGLLGIGTMLLAGQVLLPTGVQIEGQQGLIQMASMLQQTLGAAGKWIFLVGFWGAAFSSLLGVLQGVPYLFADAMSCWRSGSESNAPVPSFDHGAASRGRDYRAFLVYMALPGMLLLFIDKPIWIVLVYAVLSSLFLPLLTLMLLIMNNRSDWVGAKHRNGWKTNAILLLSLFLFGYLVVRELLDRFAAIAG